MSRIRKQEPVLLSRRIERITARLVETLPQLGRQHFAEGFGAPVQRHAPFSLPVFVAVAGVAFADCGGDACLWFERKGSISDPYQEIISWVAVPA